VPYAHLERQRVLRVHAAQLVHERDHVLHGAVRQALHAHELPAASLREAGDRTCPDSVKVSHTQPPCPAIRNRPGASCHPGTLAATQFQVTVFDSLVVLEAAVAVSLDGAVVEEYVGRCGGPAHRNGVRSVSSARRRRDRLQRVMWVRPRASRAPAVTPASPWAYHDLVPPEPRWAADDGAA